MNVVRRIEAALGPSGARLRKASPRGADRLVVELLDGGGGVTGGQWFRDAGEAARVAALVGDRFGPGSTEVLDGGHLVVQRAGADRKLRGLNRLVARPGSVLVAHRAERRAVVREASGRYTKVVRPDRVADLVAPLQHLQPDGVRTPRVVAVDHRRGWVSTAPLPGQTLHQRLGDASADDRDVVADARATGRSLRAVHEAAPTGLVLGPHDVPAEQGVVARWLVAASGFDLLPVEDCRRALGAVAEALVDGPADRRTVLVHRDFHDKQVLVDGPDVGILDLDLACEGEPEIDVANLLVHLELRTAIGWCTPERSRACAAAFLEGYGASLDPGRVEAYALATRVRLAAVYAFRPTPEDVLRRLLDPEPAAVLR